MEKSYSEKISNWGLTGDTERLALLREVENLYDAGNPNVKKIMTEMAQRWPEELEEHNIVVGDDVAEKYADLILVKCDNSELEEIISYCHLVNNEWYENYWYCQFIDKYGDAVCSEIGDFIDTHTDYEKAVEAAKKHIAEKYGTEEYEKMLADFTSEGIEGCVSMELAVCVETHWFDERGDEMIEISETCFGNC